MGHRHICWKLVRSVGALRVDPAVTGRLRYKYLKHWVRNTLAFEVFLIVGFNLLGSPIFFYVGLYRPNYILVLMGLFVLIVSVYWLKQIWLWYNSSYFAIYENGVYMQDIRESKKGNYPFYPFEQISRIEYRQNPDKGYLIDIVIEVNYREISTAVHVKDKGLVIPLLETAKEEWTLRQN